MLQPGQKTRSFLSNVHVYYGCIDHVQERERKIEREIKGRNKACIIPGAYERCVNCLRSAHKLPITRTYQVQERDRKKGEARHV